MWSWTPWLLRARARRLLALPLLQPAVAAAAPRGFATSSQLGAAAESSRQRWRLWQAALGAAGVGAAAWVTAGEDPAARAKLLWTVPVRLGRDVVTAASMVAGSVEREEAKHECHVRCADRLQALCFNNGGIYIKLGQHIGQLDHLLPAEYVKTMRKVMLDKCPTSTYPQVCTVFQAELGRLPLEVFAEFDPKPIASASLAQVHKARTQDGKTVAVKVQHAHLTDTAPADIATVRFMVNAVHYLVPSFDYRWLITEVETSLPKELDFVQEAQNAQRCAANFAASPSLADQVAVPEVHWDLTTHRLLTMEFMEGVGVTEVDAIKQLGLKPADVARLVSMTFATMIFRHGFVHCDPHAANLMVRCAPSRRTQFWRASAPFPQLVLLDHGLYRTLSPDIRENYAELWKALVFADVAKIKRYSVALGAGEDLYALFAAVLTMRPWDRISEPTLEHLQVPNTEEERKQLQVYAAQYAGEVTELLRRLPSVVLLLLKTNDCLRSVDNALGAHINTFVIIGRECALALFDMQHLRSKGTWARVRGNIHLWQVECRILGLQVAAWLAAMRVTWGLWPPSPRAYKGPRTLPRILPDEGAICPPNGAYALMTKCKDSAYNRHVLEGFVARNVNRRYPPVINTDVQNN